MNIETYTFIILVGNSWHVIKRARISSILSLSTYGLIIGLRRMLQQ